MQRKLQAVLRKVGLSFAYGPCVRQCQGFVLLSDTTPAAVAPVPAAEDGGDFLRILPNSFLQTFIDGTRATLANHGVAQTLRGIRRGSNALTMTHAVANLSCTSALATSSSKRLHLLDYNSASYFTSLPPSISSCHTLLTQPSPLSEPFSENINTFADPCTFADVRR